jgi:hypothetical protein
MITGKKIAVIGTRKRDTASAFKVIKDKFYGIYEEGDMIVSGGCPKGADRCAEQIAKESGIPIKIFYPNYKRYKQAAPIVRNTDVADEADIIIACVMRPEEGIDAVLQRTKGGTEDTIRKFVKKRDAKSLVYLV